ncbi:MAG TPA: AAA family ATPase, partial [Polyangiales bacterium]|nr:AAA family ATPase [Polyangiales bacterium]
ARILFADDARALADTVAEHVGLSGQPGRPPSHSVTGTPAYMAPEQAAGQSATAASDYYALGVMLFEALTGDLPFTGRPGEILAAKQLSTAPRAREVALRRRRAAELETAPTVSGRRRVSPVPEASTFAAARAADAASAASIALSDAVIQAAGNSVPADLEALCASLLAREPSSRPTQATLRALIAGDSPALEAPALRSSWPPDIVPELLGRAAELRELRNAYAAARAGQPTVMFVSGESGMGKSALVDAFLAELRGDARAMVLAGRCYERENVPYKGFDALVDELSRCLRGLPADELAGLLPREVHALARLFPVLGRVPLIAVAEQREIHDPQEQQSRAFAALRELFWALGRRGPLVLYIDDLQWLDRDTTALMAYLLGQRDTTPVLAIASHRSEGAEHNPLLQMIHGLARGNRAFDVRELHVGPLAADAAQALAERCLREHPEAEALGPSVIREAQGSPFFVAELARFARRRGVAELSRISLGDALSDHVTQLPAGARGLLELLALAGQPLPVALAIAAAGVADGHRALDLLRGEQLVRGSAGPDRVRRIECYHDRVREGVSAGLDEPRRRALYAALARTLEPRSDADPELLATCYEGAGERERAAVAAEQGGDRAVATLAFERAARLYERALELGAELGKHSEHSLRVLRTKRAEALVGAGRSADAAAAYREAAAGAESGLALELKRRAAYQLMTAGLVDEGRVLLSEVLAVLGLRLPSSLRAGLARALISRARLRLRGLAMQAPRTLQPVETSRALDTLWTVVQGSAGSDPFAMVDMHARYLTRALDAGASWHAARGLGYEAYLASFDGPRSWPRAQELGARALELAEAGGDVEVLAFVLGIQACLMVNLGRFAQSREPLAHAADMMRTRCRGVAFELSCLEFYEQSAAYHLGELRELGARA